MKYKYIDNEKQKHWHEIDGKPLLGTSSVCNVIAKNLTWWAAECSAVECLEAGEKIPTIREEYLEAKKKGKEGIDALQVKYPIFKKARFAHFVDKNSKADKGTDLHAVLEEYVKLCLKDFEGRPIDIEGSNLLDAPEQVKLFSKWAVQNIDRFVFSEAHCYSENLWIGGISDCGFIDKQGKVGIIDFKSAKEAYISMFIQIALYDLQLSENGGFDENGKKLLEPIKADYYAVWPFGGNVVEPTLNYDVESLRQAGLAALTLYKITNQND